MLKEQSRFIQYWLFLFDLLVIIGSWVLAYYLRFQWLPDFPIPLPLERPLGRYLSYLLVIVPIWGLLFIASGLYHPKQVQRFYNMVYAVVKAVVFGAVGVLAALFFYREFAFSRGHFAWFGVITPCFMILFRLFLYKWAQVTEKNNRRVLIIGAGRLGRKLKKALNAYPWMGFEVVGFLDDERKGKDVLGRLSDLQAVINPAESGGNPINYVYIALPLSDSKKIEKLLNFLSTRLAHVYLVPDILHFNLLNTRVSDIEGLPVIHLIDEAPMDFGRIVKRGMDIFGALGLILLSSPVMILLSILVKLSSKGPILFRQERMGLNGERFKMLKFRSMRPATVSDEERKWNDTVDRATGIGKFMRRTSLDELPQFFNVLKGDMSLVGPRPEEPVFIEKFKDQIPNYMLRHKMPTGLTGWAQVNGWRGNTSLEKRIECDLYYIQNWSIRLDIKILFLTVFKAYAPKNA
jgi:putative colanic acid biosysnthesis UDP-glucose lipid carrier transferase